MIYRLGDKVPQLKGDCFIADNATVVGSVVLGHDVNIWFNAVLRGDNDGIYIGDGSNIQDGAVLHVDDGFPVHVGKNVTVGHKVMLHGGTVGDESLIGMNAVILNGAKIGKNCLIGAHALIAEGKEIPDGSLVLGSPGKVVREISPEEQAFFMLSAEGYSARGRMYNEQLALVSKD